MHDKSGEMHKEVKIYCKYTTIQNKYTVYKNE